MGSRLLTTAVGLVTLSLVIFHPSTYFHPNTLLQSISLMPHLETLAICFTFSIPNRDVERQFMHAPIIAPVTLPNLHHFRFKGVTTYLEALVHRIVTPRLAKLQVEFFNRLTFFVPHLLQLMNTTGNLRLHSAYLTFYGDLAVATIYPHEYSGAVDTYAFEIRVFCWHLDWQVSSMVQISILSAKYYLRWSISLLYTMYTIGHLKSTIRSTPPNGGDFLARLET